MSGVALMIATRFAAAGAVKTSVAKTCPSVLSLSRGVFEAPMRISDAGA